MLVNAFRRPWSLVFDLQSADPRLTGQPFANECDQYKDIISMPGMNVNVVVIVVVSVVVIVVVTAIQL